MLAHVLGQDETSAPRNTSGRGVLMKRRSGASLSLGAGRLGCMPKPNRGSAWATKLVQSNQLIPLNTYPHDPVKATNKTLSFRLPLRLCSSVFATSSVVFYIFVCFPLTFLHSLSSFTSPSLFLIL